MIQDSGTRREFESGAVRDIQEGKGRCDLMPLKEVGQVVGTDLLADLDWFVNTGDELSLLSAVEDICEAWFSNIETAMLEVSVHYEEGAKKYGEHNWEKGIPAHSFVDSAVRHMIKHFRGDDDERHDRACIWNLLGLMWTIHNKPECNDLPYNKKEE